MNENTPISFRNTLCFLMLCFVSIACDPLHKDKCEWYLMPDPEFKELVKSGWASLCARNFTIKKEKCLFTAPIDFAEKVYGKPFKLSSLDYKESPNLREIRGLKLCEASDPTTK